MIPLLNFFPFRLPSLPPSTPGRVFIDRMYKIAYTSGMAKQKGKESIPDTKDKHAGGRPTKYDEVLHPILAESLARNGYTDKQIAGKIGVSEVTLNAWKKEHPEFLKSLKKGKEEPDSLVENSLYRRATGFDNTKAVKIFMPANAKEPVYAPYTEQVHPDVTACIFWLKNRRPDRWREKSEIQHSGDIGIMTPAERKARIEALKAKLD
jgi:hypothetical protein